MAKSRQPSSWWWEFRSLYKDFTDGLSDDMVQQIARKQAAAFRLPTVQDEVVGWWEAQLSICGLGQWDFLPHCDFHGMRDFRENQREGTLALARALHHCVEKLECYAVGHRISRGAWSPSCILRVMTSWKLHYPRLLTVSQEHLQPWQKKLHSWARILHPSRLRRIPHALLTFQRRPLSPKVQPG